MTARTTAMDADVEQAPKVIVQRHRYDFNDLAGGVDQRIIVAIGQAPEGCHYFHPAVTVSCIQPTPAFFAKVRQEQAHWCRIASQTFKKRERRRVQSWVPDDPDITGKLGLYLNRAACFTGILWINGRLVPHHEWPKPALVRVQTGRSRTAIRTSGKATQSGSPPWQEASTGATSD